MLQAQTFTTYIQYMHTYTIYTGPLKKVRGRPLFLCIEGVYPSRVDSSVKTQKDRNTACA